MALKKVWKKKDLSIEKIWHWSMRRSGKALSQLKDERIDVLLAMNTELMQTNNSLLKQLMNCPIKNQECE